MGDATGAESVRDATGAESVGDATEGGTGAAGVTTEGAAGSGAMTLRMALIIAFCGWPEPTAVRMSVSAPWTPWSTRLLTVSRTCPPSVTSSAPAANAAVTIALPFKPFKLFINDVTTSAAAGTRSAGSDETASSCWADIGPATWVDAGPATWVDAGPATAAGPTGPGRAIGPTGPAGLGM